MQIPFNGTNFINAGLTQRVFSVWPMAQPVVGEMEMHSIANLATLQTPLATFFPLKKRGQTLFSLRESPVLLQEHEVLLPQHVHTHSLSLSLSLSLSVSLLSFCSAHTSPSPRLLSFCSAARTQISLSVCLLSFCSASGREEQSLIQLNTDIMLLASLILHASAAKITVQL